MNPRNISIAILGFSFAGMAFGQASLISTVGGGFTAYGGDNQPESFLNGANVTGFALDGKGNFYLAVPNFGQVIKLFSTGGTAVIAGVPCATTEISTCFSGDGGPAINARMQPFGVVVDPSGNLLIVGNGRIRKVDVTTGIITTAVGNCTSSGIGDGGLAINACVGAVGITLDRNGNLFIADASNYKIRRVDAQTGIISTVAGNGSQGSAAMEASRPRLNYMIRAESV